MSSLAAEHYTVMQLENIIPLPRGCNVPQFDIFNIDLFLEKYRPNVKKTHVTTQRRDTGDNKNGKSRLEFVVQWSHQLGFSWATVWE